MMLSIFLTGSKKSMSETNKDKLNLSRSEFIVLLLSFENKWSYDRLKNDREEILRKHDLTEGEAVELTKKYEVMDFP